MVIGFLLLVVGCAVAAIGFMRHVQSYNRDRVNRAEALAADLQQLRVDESDYKVAKMIALKYGTAPYENHYGTMDCADGYFERCAYLIALNDGRIHRLLLKYPSLRRLGVRDWGGTALISIQNGEVTEYSFWITYKTDNGRWRGIGVEEGRTLPEFRAVQAKISDSYSIQRNDIRNGDRPSDLGFQLESSLTPTATSVERKRAWHFKFACLADTKGCGEICELMPDGWRDFYTKRGHYDVEKYGSAYLFCNGLPLPGQ